MSLLSTTEITQLRNDLTLLMTTTCSIQRITVSGTTNIPSAGYGITIATVSCNVTEMDGQRETIFRTYGDHSGDLAKVQLRTIEMPYGTDVRIDDKLTIAGTAYIVFDVRGDLSNELKVFADARRVS